jgi:hypothetical protein
VGFRHDDSDKHCYELLLRSWVFSWVTVLIHAKTFSHFMYLGLKLCACAICVSLVAIAFVKVLVS